MGVKFFVGALILSSCVLLHAQEDSVKLAAELSELSLEELMNISIYSVSKTEETTFEAPLSSSVVTKEQIRNAGCTSIMEALRLVPGVIVREQTNGNYDIHLRGLDNVPPNSSMFFFANSTTLVMIDNRPVYNYLHGGTFWETLPIDLNDVERIEVVRGPSSAMYGPNAVSGVINIITKKPEKEGLYLIANAQYGNFTNAIANTSIGYKFNEKMSAVVSGNFQNRNRTQNEYYDVVRNEFVPIDSVTSIMNSQVQNTDERYPHPGLAMRKYGYNAFFDYKINERASLSVSGGGQSSEVQNMFASEYLTTAKASTYYADFKAEAYGFNLEVSYLTGTQEPNTGVLQWQWDFNTTDVVLDYNLTKVRNLNIRPGIMYRRASYDDSPYVNEEINEGFWNGQKESTTFAAFLRADYRLLNEKLRLIAAGRLDKFNAPDKIYFSWQLAATYVLNEKNLVRIVHSKANRSPLIIDTYISTALITQAFDVQLAGNENLELLTTNMLEIGYRGKLRNNLEIDLIAFGSKTKNYSNIVTEYNYPDTATGLIRARVVFQNLTVSAFQIGGTVSVNYVLDKFQFKPFITIQQTTLYDYSPFNTSPDAPPSPFYPDPDTFNINSGIGTEMPHVGTPSVYGGAYINCELGSNFNLNFNPYFFANHTQLTSSNLTYEDGERGVQHIRTKLILNIVFSYTFAKKLTLFANFRNCFNDKGREFYKADTPDFKVLGGAHFEFLVQEIDNKKMSPRKRKNRILISVPLLFIFICGFVVKQEVQGIEEYNLKAAFIYNFTKFIDWRFLTGEEFIIGVLGDSPITKSLEEIARTKTVNDQKITIRKFASPGAIGKCQILFIPGNNTFPLNDVLAKIPQGTLSISEKEGYAIRGTAINFITVSNKLKFEANTKAIDSAGLNAGSQLLKLAVIVE